MRLGEGKIKVGKINTCKDCAILIVEDAARADFKKKRWKGEEEVFDFWGNFFVHFSLIHFQSYSLYRAVFL